MTRAAEILLHARREMEPIHDLPEKLRPHTVAEAYALQDIIAITLGRVGGWKVGAPSPDATPLYSPMPLWGGFAQSGQTISRNYRRLRGVEAEIAFRMGQDLPARSQPYSRDEVVAAIDSMHPAIEILESAFADPEKADRLSVIADLQANGGFAYGPAIPDWRSIDLAGEKVTLYVDGEVRFTGTASNTAGTDLLRLSYGWQTKAPHEPEACMPASGSRPVAGPARPSQWQVRQSWPASPTVERSGSNSNSARSASRTVRDPLITKSRKQPVPAPAAA